MESRKAQDKISDAIKKLDANAESYLFGSRARGDNGPTSDWDILILVDDAKITLEIEDKFRDLLYDIELQLGQIISTFIYPKKDWEHILVHTPLHKSIHLEGVRL